MYQNKKIFILGMARSGYEVAKLLTKYNNEILIVDDKEQDQEHVKELEDLGVKVLIVDREKQADLIDSSFDVMVKNPGIKYDNSCVLKAKELGISVVNEVEVAYDFLNKNCHIIGVTGSNGKTTVVTLIHNYLVADNKKSYLGGNIGVPLSNFVFDIKDNDFLVIEISDHQLCDMYSFKTNVSVLTDIYPTHLDFHDSYERYKEIKKRIFNNHTNNDIAIINADNEESLKVTENIISSKVYFSKEKHTDAYIKDNAIYYKDEKIIDIEDIKIKGEHNLENIMSSICAVKVFNVSNEAIRSVLKTFNGVEHRIEYVKDINGVSYYNDSKSTNCVATITALKSFNKPTILLLGGLDRGHSFDELYEYMQNVKEVLCFGETKDRIKSWCEEKGIKCGSFETLKETIKKAYDDAITGDVVLLSPACASWDQYKDFEVRGKEFKDIINNL